MTSRGSKKVGAEMSATKNIVKNEYKQFLGPTIGARPMRAAANAISSSGVSMKTYKADKMTPYLLQGLRQMRTAGGRLALKEEGAFNFSGPAPEKRNTLDVKTKVESELSGNLLFAAGSMIGVSFEFPTPIIHTKNIPSLVEKITLTPNYRFVGIDTDLPSIQLYPNGSTDYIKNIRAVHIKSGQADTSAGYLFFEFSANAIPPTDAYIPDMPYNKYVFDFDFKKGAAFTKEEMNTQMSYRAVIGHEQVFTFSSKRVSKFEHSNDGIYNDYKSLYFYNDSIYNPMYFRVHHRLATHYNGVAVAMNYTESGSTPAAITNLTNSHKTTGEISFNIPKQPNEAKTYLINTMQVTLNNKKGVQKKSVTYTNADVSYNLNKDVSYIFAKPTALTYEDGMYAGKTIMKLGTPVSKEKPFIVKFDNPLWSTNPTHLFGATDLSYAIGKGSSTYVSLPVNSTTLDFSKNALGQITYMKVQTDLSTNKYDDVDVRMSVKGPKDEVLLSKVLTLVSGDLLALPTVDGSMNLHSGFKLAATPDDATAENKLVFQFTKTNNVITDAKQLKGVTYKVGSSGAITPIAADHRLANATHDYVEISFNVASLDDYTFYVDLSKNATGTSDVDVSYEFVIPKSEIYKFPKLMYGAVPRTVNGTQYSQIGTNSLSKSAKLPYVWRLAHSSNSSGVDRLGASDNGSEVAHFKGKMDIRAVDISYTNAGTQTIHIPVSNADLDKLNSTFDLSFAATYSVDTSYDMFYSLRHGDVEYKQSIKNILEPHLIA